MITDIWLNSDSCDFGEESYFICQYYIQELCKLKFIKFHRIIVEPMPNPRSVNVLGEKSKVCNVCVKYDIASYRQLQTRKEKSEELLDLLHEGLITLCDKMNWDKSLFIQIRDQFIEKDFAVEKHFKKKRNNPKEKVYAWLSFSYEMNCTKCYVNFEKEGAALCSSMIFEAKQTIDYLGFLGNLLFNDFYWENNDVFVIADYTKEIFFKANHTNCQVELVFDLSKKSKEQLKGKLQTWQHTTSQADFKNLFDKYWTDSYEDYMRNRFGQAQD